MVGHRGPPFSSAIDAISWDSLATGSPFVRHAFLAALERSGAAARASGWTPRHVCVWQQERLLACAPAYEKRHSYGEYVFDWSWAEAWEQAGGNYYPKLSCAIPFTPVSGPRLFARDTKAREALAAALLECARGHAFSSLHVLFPCDTDLQVLTGAGLLARHGVQFHWKNRGYRDFDEFLAALTPARRKKIRQERRRVREAGVEIRVLCGEHLGQAELDFIYRCYASTYYVRGREPYLPRVFFDLLLGAMPGSVMAVLALRHGQPVACAFNLYDEHRLYGRYWGEIEHVPLLHFECCYYAGIEWCIARGLQVFEGGAQGEHKIARGFEPVKTHSAHWLADTRLATAVGRWLERERHAIERYIAELATHDSYRPSGGGGQGGQSA
ncbi:MAG: N-acetyltransferase [Rhodocyclaceae bacterium]|nr:N-acetyltransferase [Rhodocyclaceae bacterium]